MNNIVANFKFFKQDRSQSEIQITNRLANALTQRNLERLKSKPKSQTKLRGLKKEQILYVCLHGNPPIKDQFQALLLPGECIFYKVNSKGTYIIQPTEQASLNLKSEAKKINELIQQTSKTKPIVFVLHSFGNYLFSVFYDLFPLERIIGIIDVGGVAIRAYPRLVKLVSFAQQYQTVGLTQNIDSIYDAYVKNDTKSKYYPPIIFKNLNKQMLLGYLVHYIGGEFFKNIFEKVRKWPKVLKCFIFGKEDHIIPQEYLNEKSVYYTYANNFQQSYNQSLKNVWKQIYGTNCEAVQQNFIFNLQGGGHSLHVQKKFATILPAIVDEYLTFIQNLHSTSNAKM